jgi:hypothetical protein
LDLLAINPKAMEIQLHPPVLSLSLSLSVFLTCERTLHTEY